MQLFETNLLVPNSRCLHGKIAKPLYGLTPVPRVRIPPSPPCSLDCREIAHRLVRKYAKDAFFRDNSSAKRDCGEPDQRRQLPLSRLFSAGHISSPVSKLCLKRMQCDHKSMMWRNGVDFCCSRPRHVRALPKSTCNPKGSFVIPSRSLHDWTLHAICGYEHQLFSIGCSFGKQTFSRPRHTANRTHGLNYRLIQEPKYRHWDRYQVWHQPRLKCLRQPTKIAGNSLKLNCFQFWIRLKVPRSRLFKATQPAILALRFRELAKKCAVEVNSSATARRNWRSQNRKIFYGHSHPPSIGDADLTAHGTRRNGHRQHAGAIDVDDGSRNAAKFD